MQPTVYILASKLNGTLYIGVTSDLIQRMYQHKYHATGFVKKYSVTRLVFYEIYEDMHSALTREKQLKNWRRAWKITLIEQNNPSWRDLVLDLL
ncbi:GIY-YIG nuclease family protein [Thiopseudomonas alkaliphila]|uniref:GIY-YIG domain-containing protein n=1 Tax=Thiopseudomonas alkaliphila TaxID=1697053 RepID=A0A0K1XF83_9GAMM|nr:GIY-YIG nuclease family protein [Thiopseudomonas alkaliphila]AKX50917.1 hypothetical protein AKN92_04955 [Thiopseudomonas alkaliphila]AKX57251.1 hypothetical protein AKN89_04975 [Thiopseudomonas alkaliphila]AKX59833.1 hypothetical protein AKN88_07770 [Thiopseudomonas alkaliphila]